MLSKGVEGSGRRRNGVRFGVFSARMKEEGVDMTKEIYSWGGKKKSEQCPQREKENHGRADVVSEPVCDTFQGRSGWWEFGWTLQNNIVCFSAFLLLIVTATLRLRPPPRNKALNSNSETTH